MKKAIISRFVAKMPTFKNSIKIRYELELSVDDKFYQIIRYQYVSNKLTKAELRGVAKNKVIAREQWIREINFLIDFI